MAKLTPAQNKRWVQLRADIEIHQPYEIDGSPVVAVQYVGCWELRMVSGEPLYLGRNSVDALETLERLIESSALQATITANQEPAVIECTPMTDDDILFSVIETLENLSAEQVERTNNSLSLDELPDTLWKQAFPALHATSESQHPCGNDGAEAIVISSEPLTHLDTVFRTTTAYITAPHDVRQVHHHSLATAPLHSAYCLAMPLHQAPAYPVMRALNLENKPLTPCLPATTPSAQATIRAPQAELDALILEGLVSVDHFLPSRAPKGYSTIHAGQAELEALIHEGLISVDDFLPSGAPKHWFSHNEANSIANSEDELDKNHHDSGSCFATAYQDNLKKLAKQRRAALAEQRISNAFALLPKPPAHLSLIRCRVAKRQDAHISITHTCGHIVEHPLVGRFGVDTCVIREQNRECLACCVSIRKVIDLRDFLAASANTNWVSNKFLSDVTGIPVEDVSLFMTALACIGYVQDGFTFVQLKGHTGMLSEVLVRKTTVLWIAREASRHG